MDCIFCKIIAGKAEAAKIWSDGEFTAILDLYPNVKGQTLLISNEHFNSDLSEMPKLAYVRFMFATRDVIEMLKKGLNVKRVAIVVEGMGVDHAHIKLYPLHGLQDSFQEMWSKERVFFEKYEGYITTQVGPKAEIPDLKKLAQDIAKFAI